MSLGLDRELLIEGFDDENVAAYFSYAVDMAVIFGADRFNAELEMKDVLSFEIALANVSSDDLIFSHNFFANDNRYRVL